MIGRRRMPKGRRARCAAAAIRVAVLWLLIPVPAFAIDGSDWGVTVDGATAVRYSEELGDQEFAYRVRTALWTELFRRVGDGGALVLSAEGSFAHADDRDYLANLDRLRLSLSRPGTVGRSGTLFAAVGRFAFRDPTAQILNTPADGGRIGLRFPRWELELWGGYTGLLLNPVSRVRVSTTDRAEENDDDQLFGPRRALAQAELRFPDLAARQLVSVATLAQWDLLESSDDTVHSQYATLLVAGPLGRNLYHTSFTGLSLVQAAEDRTGLIAVSRLRYLREDWYGSRFNLGLLYTSGSQGALDPFVPITQPTIGRVYQPRAANVTTLSAGYAVRPWIRSESLPAQAIELSAGGRTFLRSADRGTVDGGGLLAVTSPVTPGNERYLGSEVEWGVRARPLPVLGFALTGGVFLPGAAFGDQAQPEYLGRFELSLAL